MNLAALTRSRTPVAFEAMRIFVLLLSWLLGLSCVTFAERRAGDPTEEDTVAACLSSWGDQPFGRAEDARFKVLSASVKVLGIGVDIVDDAVTSEPQLVLVKPSVNVLGKSNFRLLNPNGWYCFESAVTVLAKSVITAHCSAHLASSIDGVAVAGGNHGTEGVTVLGTSVVKRVGCEPGA